MSISNQRQQIRQLIREKRQKLTALEQAQAEQNIAQKALDVIEKFRAEHIALYLSFDGEISTKLLIEQLWQQEKKVYLPVLHPFSPGNLLFLAFQKDTPMHYNKFGILEPKLNVRNVLPVSHLDLIFTPLVAFDKDGNRLGMGGGFYDRTLQNWKKKSFVPVGLAHQIQEVERLPIESWDIPLAEILTG
ncbi:5-formyltetrahydrofolate cyclo-ligase [Histophilus somni]|uniref:5-formyltetrahydrofolate cyclo-ligase n=1 Tax=Histophilus somni TaxID=731 RepID=UPI00201F726A|nr:5-formyltetrahydrofolate cyclo-ligase [Histophilus somni]